MERKDFKTLAAIAVLIILPVCLMSCSPKTHFGSEEKSSSSNNPGGPSSGFLGQPGPGPSCIDQPGIEKTVLDKTYTERIRLSEPSSPAIIDARSGLSLTSGERALEIGSKKPVNNMCIVGWTVIGQQSRTLTWRQMHDDLGGSALRVYGSNYVVDGLRAENVQDGFDPREGDGFELRNVWMQYIRDDCIENDEFGELTVRDSLFDGCYTFLSEQESGSVDGESLILENILVRLQPMPAPHGEDDPSILGHGSFFKKFDKGGRHQPIIRNSIFFLEKECHSGCKDWPPGTQATNVTLVWTGTGNFPMSILPGMTLTKDRSVWDNAVQRWKARHGCTTMDKPCTKLHNPDPL